MVPTVQFSLSTDPSDCGCKATVHIFLMPKRLLISLNSLDSKFRPWSVWIIKGVPNLATNWLTKTSATFFCILVSDQVCFCPLSEIVREHKYVFISILWHWSSILATCPSGYLKDFNHYDLFITWTFFHLSSVCGSEPWLRCNDFFFPIDILRQNSSYSKIHDIRVKYKLAIQIGVI